MDSKPLTLLSASGGCAAKVGPNELQQLIDALDIRNPDSLLNLKKHKDAGFWQLSKSTILVQSIDVITPVTDNPYNYGAIAVAHALGDIYAKGAEPILGLLTLGIPYTEVSLDVGKDILQGAVDKLNEAGGILMKGHTISNKQLEVGVAVTGIMHRDPICDHGCKSGDILVMTKPLGIGILVTALKLWNARMPLEGFLMDAFSVAENAMLELNSKASKAIIEVGVNACTDISGFGLIGHLIPMLQDSRLSAVLNWKSIPVLAGALDLARQLVIPGTGEQNFAFWGDFCEFAESMREEKLVLFDPQTSGGLLISVSPEKIEELITKFEMFDFKNYAVIGHIVDEEKHSVIVQDEESL